MARRHTRGFTRPAPRTKMWIGGGAGPSTLAASSKTLISTLGVAALALRPFTVLRSRYEVMFESDQEGASERPEGAFGEAVVNDVAAALGITALPGPLNEIPYDWFIWQGMIHRFQFITGTGTNNPGGTHYVIDSKAMRKVGTEDNMAQIFEMRAAVGGTITIEGRNLIQLH